MAPLITNLGTAGITIGRINMNYEEIHQILLRLDNKIKGGWVGGACSTHWR